jgi:hypothetical protein
MKGFSIFIHTVFQGEVPSIYDGEDQPDVYATRKEAEREIVEFAMERMQQFLDGDRDFDDAITVEEYVRPVERQPDGTLVTITEED